MVTPHHCESIVTPTTTNTSTRELVSPLNTTWPPCNPFESWPRQIFWVIVSYAIFSLCRKNWKGVAIQGGQTKGMNLLGKTQNLMRMDNLVGAFFFNRRESGFMKLDPRFVQWLILGINTVKVDMGLIYPFYVYMNTADEYTGLLAFDFLGSWRRWSSSCSRCKKGLDILPLN